MVFGELTADFMSLEKKSPLNTVFQLFSRFSEILSLFSLEIPPKTQPFLLTEVESFSGCVVDRHFGVFFLVFCGVLCLNCEALTLFSFVSQTEVESFISEIIKIGTTNPRLELLWNILWWWLFVFVADLHKLFHFFLFACCVTSFGKTLTRKLSKEHAWFRVDVGFQGGFVTSTGFSGILNIRVVNVVECMLFMDVFYIYFSLFPKFYFLEIIYFKQSFVKCLFKKSSYNFEKLNIISLL